MSRLLNDPAVVGALVAIVVACAGYLKTRLEVERTRAEIQLINLRQKLTQPAPTYVQVPAGTGTVEIHPPAAAVASYPSGGATDNATLGVPTGSSQ